MYGRTAMEKWDTIRFCIRDMCKFKICHPPDVTLTSFIEFQWEINCTAQFWIALLHYSLLLEKSVASRCVTLRINYYMRETVYCYMHMFYLSYLLLRQNTVKEPYWPSITHISTQYFIIEIDLRSGFFFFLIAVSRRHCIFIHSCII